MISQRNNEELILSIKNGKEEAIHVLRKKYFQSSRRWLRRNGISDSATPDLFAKVLVKVYRDIQQNRMTAHVDLEKYIFNSLNEFLIKEKEQRKEKRKNGMQIPTDKEMESVVACYSILEEQTKKLLSARYSEKLTFEEIAARFDFSNPVIAQFEVNKAFQQLQQVAAARLNINL